MRKFAVALALVLTACAPLQDDVSLSEQPLNWPTNGEGTDALLYSGIFANTINNRLLTTHGLTELTSPPNLSAVNSYNQFDFYKVATMDQLSREALGYWASCALSAGHTVTIPQGYDSNGWGYGPPLTLNGSLGLCDYWSDSAPSEECLESVSACMLARNNQTRTKVIFSQRGLTPNYIWRCIYGGGCSYVQQNISVAARLPVISETEPGTAVTSSIACTGTTYNNRDCGWKPLYVALANPGTTVTLSAVNSNSSGDTMLRVCAGYQMCNSNAAIAFNDDTSSPSYDVRPTVTFTVPSGSKGVYSVQWAPYNSSDTYSSVGDLTVTNATYPAAELNVFSIKEGSFYGRIFLQPTESAGWNINFDPYGYCPGSNINMGPIFSGGCRTKTGGGGSGNTLVFPSMNVCTAPGWNDEYGYAVKRVCAAGGCAATHTGTCTQKCSYRSSDQSYRGCYDNNNASWSYGITSSVHLPCDVVSDPAYCGWIMPPG